MIRSTVRGAMTALIILILALSSVQAAGLSTPVAVDANTPAQAPDRPDAEGISESKLELVAVEDTVFSATEPAIYIIRLVDAPLASYRGGVAGLEATNPAVKGEPKLDVRSSASVSYLEYLEGVQAQFIASMEQAVDRAVEVKFQYKYATNGMAVWLTPQEADAVAKLQGVVSVERDAMSYPTTDVGPAFIGAEGIWDGTSTGGLPGTKGEGVIVGILDSGINIDHPSFAATGDDGYVHTNPFGAGNYVGLCATQPGTFTCNSKLIGLWDFTAEDAMDDDDAAHGSHTASTVAGNVVYSPTVHAPTVVVTVTKISGVAPHANIIAYDVCHAAGCPNSATTFAKDQAIADGVDVINYSIGGGGANPWTDSGSQEWLTVRDAGIFVATSAGNAGPGAETMGSPGNSPWMLTVGASSHNRVFSNALTDIISGTTSLPDIMGEGMTGGYGPAPIVYAGAIDPTNPGCDLAYPPNTFSGEIVVCEHDPHGPNYVSRVNKSEMLAAAGAGGFIMNTEAEWGVSLAIDSYALPGMGITNEDGEMLKAGIASGAIQTATIRGVESETSRGDIMAAFSSRGPNPDSTLAAGIIKPDVTAPGRRVLAAIAVDNPVPGGPPEFDVYQGTSMSSPHAAGAAALLRALHPDWSPAEIQSALMATANSDRTLKEDGVTPADPFDVGAGRIDLSLAAQAGLVLHETTENFEDADPGEGGDPTTLNLASLGNGLCLQQCTWNRTFRNTLEVATTYTAVVDSPAGMVVTVDPVTFTVPALGTQVVSVEADVSTLPVHEWAFAEVGFETDAMHPEFTVLWEESFEGVYPPTGWYTYTTGDPLDPGWLKTDMTSHTGDYSVAHFDDQVNAVSWLVTPQFTPTTQTQLAFWQYTYYDSYYYYHGIWVSDGSGNPSDGDFVELVELDGGTLAWEQVIQDLGSYAGTPIYVAFRYDGNWADWWFVDDVAIRDGADSALAVSDLHMPLAVRPSTGILPNLVEISTRRNAGSQLIEDLQAIEITDLTITPYGLTEATLYDYQLYQDPTHDIPSGFFDDLDQVFWMTMTVQAGDERLVAEIVDTTSPDLDMAVGRDLDGDGPEADEIVCQSATGTAYEYCDVSGADLVAGEWWLIVMNWLESASAPDDITMAVALVGADSGNMTVTGPAAVAEKTEFDLRLFWDTPIMEAGDRWYGAFAIGSDGAHPGNVGTIPVNLVRYPDDVVKTASPVNVDPGDTVDYTISVYPDITGQDLTYTVTDTIPAGLTYVPGSAYAPTGVINVVGNVLTWSGQVIPEREYAVSTSLSDPLCTMPLANSGSYVDLEQFGITTDPTVSGNNVAYQDTGYNGGPFAFYGDPRTSIVYFTDDGYVSLDAGSAVSGTAYANAAIPTGGLPNALMAMLWNDMEIVYEGGSGENNRGATTGVRLTSGGVPTAKLQEFDDIQLVGDPNSQIDFEMLIAEAVIDAAGEYEVIFAYDNIVGSFDSLTTGTIGVEGYDGLRGTQYAYNDANLQTLEDGMAICFDYVIPDKPLGITYQVVVSDVVEPGDVIVNTVLHNTDNPGSMEDSTSAQVKVFYPIYLPLVLNGYTP